MCDQLFFSIYFKLLIWWIHFVALKMEANTGRRIFMWFIYLFTVGFCAVAQAVAISMSVLNCCLWLSMPNDLFFVCAVRDIQVYNWKWKQTSISLLSILWCEFLFLLLLLLLLLLLMMIDGDDVYTIFYNSNMLPYGIIWRLCLDAVVGL